MRVLLDESLPRDLAALVVGHEVTTVRRAGWSGIKNGELLALAATQFDVFVTADRNLEFQQNLTALPIAVAVLVVPSTRIQDIEPLVTGLIELLEHIPPRVLRRVGG